MTKYIFSFMILLGTIHATETTPATSTYPLSTCVVSGDKLGQMETPTIIHYQGTEVQLCCKDCAKDFEKDPDKYLKKIKEAQQKPTKSAP